MFKTQNSCTIDKFCNVFAKKNGLPDVRFFSCYSKSLIVSFVASLLLAFIAAKIEISKFNFFLILIMINSFIFTISSLIEKFIKEKYYHFINDNNFMSSVIFIYQINKIVKKYDISCNFISKLNNEFDIYVKLDNRVFKEKYYKEEISKLIDVKNIEKILYDIRNVAYKKELNEVCFDNRNLNF